MALLLNKETEAVAQVKQVCAVVSNAKMNMFYFHKKLSENSSGRKWDIWNELLSRFEHSMDSLGVSIGDKTRVGSILMTISEKYIAKTNKRRVIFNL